MVFGDDRSAGSRVATVTWSDRGALLSLLLLDIFGEIRESLEGWLATVEHDDGHDIQALLFAVPVEFV